MLSRLRLLLLVTALWHECPAICVAQTALGVTVGGSSQSVGDTDRPFLGPGFGGTAVAGVFFVDRAVGDRISLGAETSVSANITERQQQRALNGSNDFTSRHHDAVFSGVLKMKLVDVEHAQLDGAVGAGVGWRHTAREGAFLTNQPPFTRSSFGEVLSNAVFAATLGFDGVAVISAGTGLVFSVRVHLLADDDREAGGVVRRGVGSRIVRFGGGGRFVF